MRPLRYYQFIEKDTSEITVAWKVMHAMIFALIAFSSTASLYAFCDIFDIFNYHCVLNCKPFFSYQHAPHDNRTVNGTNQTDIIGYNPEIALRSIKINKTNRTVVNARSAVVANLRANTADEFPMPDENYTNPTLEIAEPIPDATDMYVYKDRIWHIKKDGVVKGWIYIVMHKSGFSTPIMCDYAIMAPLLSLLTSAVFAAVVTVCGKGGRGYESDAIPGAWIVVYPIVIASAVMFILSVHVSNVVHKGLRNFCAHASRFIGEKDCNEYMNYFTVQQMMGCRDFNLSYLVCFYSYTITVLLWLSQLLTGLLRIVSFTDFDFTSVLVKKKNQDAAVAEEVWETSQAAKLTNIVTMLKMRSEQEKKATLTK